MGILHRVRGRHGTRAHDAGVSSGIFDETMGS